MVVGAQRVDASPRWSRAVGVLVAVAALYVLAGQARPDLRTGPQATLAVALIAGVTTAFVVVVDRRRLPGYLAAVALLAVAIRLPRSGPALLQAVVIAGAGVASLLLYRRLVGPATGVDLARRRSVRVLVTAGLAAAALNALTLAALLPAAQAAGLLPPALVLPADFVLGTRLAAQVSGIVTLTPLVLLVLRAGWRSWPLRSRAEVIVCAAVLLGLGTVGSLLRELEAAAALAAFVALALVLRAVLREGVLAAAVLTPVLAVVAALLLAPDASTVTTTHAQTLGTVVAQVCGVVAAVAAWTVCGVVLERDAAVRSRHADLESRVARGEARLAAALSGLPDPVVLAAPAGPGATVDGAEAVPSLRVTYVSGAAEAWGLREGQDLTARLATSEARALERLLDDAWRSGAPVVVDDLFVSSGPGRPDDRHVDLRAVRNGDELIVSWRDVTARHRYEADLARRAAHDDLTGLGNRILLTDRIDVALGELARTEGVVAVLYLDLDKFKDVNDSWGHAAGDAVLREVAERIRSTLREVDTAARISGDEFAVVARVHDALDATALAQRLHDAVLAPIVLPAGRVEIAPSIGVTTSDRPGADVESLLREADLAMFPAKRRGRPWEVFDVDLQRRAHARLVVQDELRTALREGWFRLVYQPVLDLGSRRVVGVEALLRMEHPDRGLVAPAAFIDVAESTDLIVPIGAWVLEQACLDLARWDAGPLRLSVNVSGRQLRRADVPGQLMAAAASAGVAPSSLTVEITERVLLEDTGQVMADLRRLTDLGCGLAIDDFGTGYSSLTYLKRFPVSEVKVDKSFVDGLGRDEEDTAIVAAVTGLARTLDLVAVAEGVERPEQLAELERLGCQRAQGYLLGRPMRAEDVGALLARGRGTHGRTKAR